MVSGGKQFPVSAGEEIGWPQIRSGIGGETLHLSLPATEPRSSIRRAVTNSLLTNLSLYSYNKPTQCTFFYLLSLPRLYTCRAIFSPSTGGQMYNVAMVLILTL
jgi:hypothetical protein